MGRSLALCCAALVALPVSAVAQQIDMTLTEAVHRALERQVAIIMARGEQRNANAARRAATGAFLPTITVSGGSSNAGANRYNSATGQIVSVPTSTTYNGAISVSLDLFLGFRRLANRKAAAATADAADAGLTNQRYQVTATTAQLFFGALAAEELVRVAQAQLDRAREELQISVNKFQVGAATRADTLTSTVDVGTAQVALLQAQGNLATAQADLASQVGMDQPVHAVPDSAFPAPPDTTGLRQQVVDASPQVQQADAQARAARARVGVAHAEYWPTLSASYSNGYTGIDTLGRFALQPWMTTQSYVNNWGLRFSLGWTLFNGFSREADQVSASVARDEAEASAAALRRQLNAQLTQQVSTLFTAHAQIAISGANVAAAAEALRVQQERYRLGAGTLLDLLTAEAAATQAEVNLVQARYNYLIARAQVEALVGREL